METFQNENTSLSTKGANQMAALERLNSAVNGKLAISVPKMAEILSISNPTAYALARRAGFPAFQVGNRTLVSVPGLVAWVQQASAGEVL